MVGRNLCDVIIGDFYFDYLNFQRFHQSITYFFWKGREKEKSRGVLSSESFHLLLLPIKNQTYCSAGNI